MTKKRKIWLVSGLFWIVSLLGIGLGGGSVITRLSLGLAGASTQGIYPETLTIADFSDIPGVTQEYVDAYKIFLKAKTQDKGEYTYERAVVAFEEIAKTTKNPELKLRSLFLVTFGNFLQMKIDDAYQSGVEVLLLCKELRKEDKRVIFLNKLVLAIQEGDISEMGEIKEILKSEESVETAKEEVSGLVEDLSLYQQSSKEYQEMKIKAKK